MNLQIFLKNHTKNNLFLIHRNLECYFHHQKLILRFGIPNLYKLFHSESFKYIYKYKICLNQLKQNKDLNSN